MPAPRSVPRDWGGDAPETTHPPEELEQEVLPLAVARGTLQAFAPSLDPQGEVTSMAVVVSRGDSAAAVPLDRLITHRVKEIVFPAWRRRLVADGAGQQISEGLYFGVCVLRIRTISRSSGFGVYVEGDLTSLEGYDVAQATDREKRALEGQPMSSGQTRLHFCCRGPEDSTCGKQSPATYLHTSVWIEPTTAPYFPAVDDSTRFPTGE